MDSLGIRCLRFMENEMKAGVKSNPNLPASPRVKEYFSICTRKINGKEVKLNLTQGNWCAAAVSFSLYSSLKDEEPKHGYRVGCIEIQNDLIQSKNWVDVKSVINGTNHLMLGDIMITDRSKKNDPKTAWWRHILRVSKINNDGTFECISGNSTNGEYRISKHKLTDPNIIGFGFIDPRNVKTTIVQPIEVEEKDLNPEISLYDLYEDLLK